MPRGVYDHSRNKGFTGKKHTAYSKKMMSEGQRIRYQRKIEVTPKSQIGYMGTSGTEMSDHDY